MVRQRNLRGREAIGASPYMRLTFLTMKTAVVGVVCRRWSFAAQQDEQTPLPMVAFVVGLLVVALHPSSAGANEPEDHEDTRADADDQARIATHRARARRSKPPRTSALTSFLTRQTMVGPRFVDHGVLGVGIAGGYPHRYRLELTLGVLDYLTLGVTAHWLPGQAAPGWSPKVSAAFWRGRMIEIGAHYQRTLYPPAPIDDDAAEPNQPTSFQPSAHWVLGSATFSQWFVAAGFDLGLVYLRERDPALPDDAPPSTIDRIRPAGGMHLRAGTRRWGFTIQALWPEPTAELLFDVRFGVFEKRPRGGWNPGEVVATQSPEAY